MLRDPALHIRRSDLQDILQDLGLDTKLADTLLSRAVKLNIRNRVVVQTRARAAKKVDRVTSMDDHLAETFNGIYTSMLKENKIRAARIDKTHKNYLNMKEVASHVQDFMETFDFEDYKSASKYYIQLAIDLLGRNFTLVRMKSNHEKIMRRYAHILCIDQDPNVSTTKQCYQAWKTSMLKYQGRSFDVEDVDQYVTFVFAAEDVVKVKAIPQDWMDAQFERWAFLNSIPEFSQLYGDNALLAYNKYMAKEGVKYESSEERKYFEKIRAKRNEKLKYQ